MGISAQKNAKKCVERLASNASSGFIWCYSLVEPSSINVDNTGFFKKNSHPVKLIAKKLARPLSPNSMLLHRFAWKGFQKKQAFRFGCRHALGNNIDQGGVGGSGVCDNM